MTYKEALEYLESFIDYEKLVDYDYSGSLKLDRMEALAAKLGNPHEGLRCIHISGTKGKGSTAAMVFSILKEAGFKAGLYTSPHLLSFRERIRVDEELISEPDLARLAGIIKAQTDLMDKNGDEYPTFFEVYTALAFLYFKEKRAAICVIEVGMGGRLDATNIIKPLCCAITPVSLEHTQKLGDTVEKIAREKAGIIKKGSVCISSPQDVSAATVIKQACADAGCKLYEVGRQITLKEEGYDTILKRQFFSVKGMFQKYENLELGLLGDHQLVNAAAAIGLVESLRFYDIIISYNNIRAGLAKVQWPGRLQILQVNPYIVLDGAQNRASAKALKTAIKKFFKYSRLILILGISKDKDIKGICEELGPVSDTIILTRAGLPRAEEPSKIKEFIGKEVCLTGTVSEAIKMSETISGGPDLVLITGSLFVVGEALGLKGSRLEYVKT